MSNWSECYTFDVPCNKTRSFVEWINNWTIQTFLGILLRFSNVLENKLDENFVNIFFACNIAPNHEVFVHKTQIRRISDGASYFLSPAELAVHCTVS